MATPQVQNWHPFVPLQSEPAECGVVCIAVLSAMYGVPLCPASIKSKFGISTRGLAISQLIQILRTAGFGVRALRIEQYELFANTNTPVCALWEDNHFVVLGRRSNAGAKIFDPNKGWGFVASSELVERLSGLAIEITDIPKKPLLPLRQPFELKLWLSSFKFSKKLRKLVLASLFAQSFLLGLPLVTKNILDAAIPGGSMESMAIGLVSFGVISSLGLIARSYSQRYTSRVAANLNPQLINDVSTRLLKKPMSYLSRQIPAVMSGKILTVRLIQRFMIRIFGSTIVMVTLGAAALALIGHLNVLFFLVLLVSTLVGITVDRVLIRRVSAAQERENRALVILNAGLLEMMRTASTIKAYNATRAVINQTQANSDSVAESSIALNLASQNRTDIKSAFDIIERTIFLTLGAWMISVQSLTIGSYVAIGLYRELAKNGLDEIANILAQFMRLKIASGRLEEVIDPHEQLKLPTHNQLSVELDQFNITVTGLSFRYSKFDDKVFQNLALSVDSGECVAIIGPSGCGKSTLAKLLAGLLTPDQGSIFIGNVQVCEQNEQILTNQVATVMQSDFLITGTIRENIDFHRDNSIESIRRAANISEIADFIESLPMRYETSISDDFEGLSGGQRQRILLARALAGNPKVLILDEATSYLDKSTERRIAISIKNLKMTRIIFAHREETIQMTDRIIKLSELDPSS